MQSVKTRPLVVTEPFQPVIVSVAAVLWGLILIPTGLAMVLGLLSIVFGDRSTASWCSIAAPLFAFEVYFGRMLSCRTKAAWVTQLVLSTIGLALFPFGTLINVILLLGWTRPATKSWFGLDSGVANKA